jgi:hypothetical protein
MYPSLNQSLWWGECELQLARPELDASLRPEEVNFTGNTGFESKGGVIVLVTSC